MKRRLEAMGGEFSRRQATKRRRAEESARIEKAKESEQRACLQEIEERRKADEVCHLNIYAHLHTLNCRTPRTQLMRVNIVEWGPNIVAN